ncbi:MAG TPA: FAD-dependent oxidoreductase [Thermoplasmata archaeon]|nr:FAD-dependent oxidoreductase [Thermoplasmata archaeon]
MAIESPPVDLLILGAGIAGCALAHHVAERRLGSVRVYDPRTPAAGASGRAAGVVTEQLWDHWDVEVTRESHHEYSTLCRRWEPTAYRQNGFLRWTRDAEAAQVMAEAKERLRSWGVEVEEPSIADLERLVPEGRFNDVTSALYSRHDACVTPSALTALYAESARRAGVVFDFGQPMRSIRREGALWKVEAAGMEHRARRVVLAAGAWSKKLLEEVGHPAPLCPYRTQAALLRPPKAPAELFPTVHDVDLDVYVRPEDRGRILGGDGTEHVEADPERFATGGDPGFLAHLAASLADRLPGWADCEVVSSWAGVCTSTPDRHPLVGPVPGATGLYIMTGFNGFGVMRAGGTARRLADLLADGEDSGAARDALRPVWPGRFTNSTPTSFAPKPGFTLEGGDDPRF